MDALSVSERRACKALGQHRSTQRKVPRGGDDEEALTADLIELARKYGRYGYRKISALLRTAGWLVNDKRVERIWRREGLRCPRSSPSAAGSGTRTAPAPGCGPSTATTSGPTASWRSAPMTDARPPARREEARTACRDAHRHDPGPDAAAALVKALSEALSAGIVHGTARVCLPHLAGQLVHLRQRPRAVDRGGHGLTKHRPQP